jgi:hypothetical protein
MKKNLVMRGPFKKDACVICGKRLNPKYADIGIGDRCYKAAKKRFPSIFGEDGKVIRELVTEDIRLDLMEFMSGKGKENKAPTKKTICYCVEVDEDPVDAAVKECPCEEEDAP